MVNAIPKERLDAGNPHVAYLRTNVVARRVLALCGTIVSTTLAWGAGASLSDVRISQTMPWQKIVAIDYTLSGADGPQDVVVTATTGGQTLTVPAAAVSGDVQSLGNGAHRLYIDPFQCDWGEAAYLADFTVSLGVTPARTFMIVDLDTALDNTVAARVSYTNAVIGSGKDYSGNPAWDDDYKTSKLVLRRIPAGTFKMGESNVPMRISRPFYIGVFEFTQGQLERVLGKYDTGYCFYTNQSDRAMRPVDNTPLPYGNYRWPDNAMNVGGILSSLRKKCASEILFHAPSAPEWEYACRAGTTTPYYTGDSSYPSDLGNCYRNDTKPAAEHRNQTSAEGGTMPVGSYRPNNWGLYDMAGNVAEVTRSWYRSQLGMYAYTDDPAVLRADCCQLHSVDSIEVRGGAFWVSSGNVNYSAKDLARSDKRYYNMREASYYYDYYTPGVLGFRVYAPDQPCDAPVSATSAPITLHLKPTVFTTTVLAKTVTLGWRVPDVWTRTNEVAVTRVTVTSARRGTILSTNVTEGVSCSFEAFGETVPSEDDAFDLSLAFVGTNGVVLAAQTNALALVCGAFGSVNVPLNTRHRLWRYADRTVDLIPYASDWANFPSTNGPAFSLTVSKEDAFATNRTAAESGWFVWRPTAETPWGKGLYGLKLEETYSPLDVFWTGTVRLGVPGLVVFVK